MPRDDLPRYTFRCIIYFKYSVHSSRRSICTFLIQITILYVHAHIYLYTSTQSMYPWHDQPNSLPTPSLKLTCAEQLHTPECDSTPTPECNWPGSCFLSLISQSPAQKPCTYDVQRTTLLTDNNECLHADQCSWIVSLSWR